MDIAHVKEDMPSLAIGVGIALGPIQQAAVIPSAFSTIVSRSRGIAGSHERSGSGSPKAIWWNTSARSRP
jgi:hypothetical protein